MNSAVTFSLGIFVCSLETVGTSSLLMGSLSPIEPLVVFLGAQDWLG
jgi:hypothetical protein